MKKIILITIVVLLTRNCYSQTANYFVDGSIWTYNTDESYEPGMCVTHSILEKDSIQGDTLINTFIYKKLFVTSQETIHLYPPCWNGGGPQPTTMVEKYLRYDTLSKKVFLLDDTSATFQEKVLNNFNLSAGDTIPFTGNFPAGYNVIDSVSNILFFGIPALKFYLPDFSLGNYIIEGIGNSNGLTYFNPNLIVISGGIYMTSLLCFKSGDSIYNPSSNTCPQFVPVPVSIIEKNKNGFHVNVSPNPFTSETTISFTEKQKNTTIKITNLVGKEIKSMNFTGSQLTIERGNIQSGIYFIQTMDTKKNISFNKIIIQ